MIQSTFIYVRRDVYFQIIMEDIFIPYISVMIQFNYLENYQEYLEKVVKKSGKLQRKGPRITNCRSRAPSLQLRPWHLVHSYTYFNVQHIFSYYPKARFPYPLLSVLSNISYYTSSSFYQQTSASVWYSVMEIQPALLRQKLTYSIIHVCAFHMKSRL